MKSPVWIANSILALFLLATVLYILLAPKTLPLQPSLTVGPAQAETGAQSHVLDEGFLKTIYQENDLFGTYVPAPPPEAATFSVPSAPPPPAPKPLLPLQPVSVNFLDPLKITITGIISGSDEADNQVIIADNATKQEKSYKVGDKLADAHVLRIFNNKVLLIRSNGQQETVYINAAEAQAEMKLLRDKSWTDVVQKESDFAYTINIPGFIARVPSLAQCMEMLDVTTVFNKGRSVGCRIGKITDDSLGAAMGLMPGDIITRISGQAPTSTKNRVDIYNRIRLAGADTVIPVQLTRYNREIKLSYTLQSQASALNAPETLTDESDLIVPGPEPTPEKIELMREKYKFNPLAQDMYKRDRQAMARYGSRAAVLTKSHPKS